jgi:hypothetical protein
MSVVNQRNAGVVMLAPTLSVTRNEIGGPTIVLLAGTDGDVPFTAPVPESRVSQDGSPLAAYEYGPVPPVVDVFTLVSTGEDVYVVWLVSELARLVTFHQKVGLVADTPALSVTLTVMPVVVLFVVATVPVIFPVAAVSFSPAGSVPELNTYGAVPSVTRPVRSRVTAFPLSVVWLPGLVMVGALLTVHVKGELTVVAPAASVTAKVTPV